MSGRYGLEIRAANAADAPGLAALIGAAGRGIA
ncbi:GNAT family N-acetyltransferase, partial [Methylobacterium sp. WL103]